MDNSDNIQPLKPLEDKELIFAESYLVHLNKAQAARDAGYSIKTAKQIGFEIYNKPHVQEYIKAKIKERVVSAEETIKMTSDAAKASLTDYMVPVKVRKSKLKQVGLQVIIDEKIALHKFEKEFANRVKFDEKEQEYHDKSQKALKRDIIRLRLELELNPKASRIIHTPDELVTEMQLDMNLLVADKERGKVKKLKFGVRGPEIELLDPDAARESLNKMHGNYAKDNEKVVFNYNAEVTDEEARAIKKALQDDV